jgi:hypothetical protein
MRSCDKTKGGLLVSFLEVTFKFLVVPFLAWRVGNYNPLLQTDRQTGEHVDTDTELGERYSQLALTTRLKMPDVMVYYLVVLISSYNKENESTSFCLHSLNIIQSDSWKSKVIDDRK